jgi:preprotein translocase subunit SecY
VIILVTGTIFAMWLGEKITDKGWKWYFTFNMVGILARFPQAFIQSLQLELRITTVVQCCWLSKLLFGF